MVTKQITRTQIEVLLAPGREYYCRLFAGFEPHPVVAFDDETYIRCDR